MHVIVIRRRNLFIVTALLTMVLFTFFFFNDILNSSRAVFFPMTNRAVFIDAGHGGRDPGAVGRQGANEDRINLEIALRLKRLVEEGGGIAILTRDGDYGLYSPDAPNKKRDDLQKRKAIADQSDSCVNVIIHLNSFSQSRYYGAQVFYHRGSEEGRRLAVIMQEELRRVLDRDNYRQPKADDDIYLLKDNKVPTVLVECGFLSNPEEERLLNDERYQEKVAFAIYSGILRYLTE
ncbi:MAG: N-acetylmuramoyl-L-alanine amidase [Clostridia bacterium]|nr:N-acetylmuramoyl-L-alanine amidase [Clostridiales bacterium]